MCMKNLKFVALPVPEIIEIPGKIGQSLDTPTYASFAPQFLMGFCSDGPSDALNVYRPNLKSVSFPVHQIIVGTQKI